MANTLKIQCSGRIFFVSLSSCPAAASSVVCSAAATGRGGAAAVMYQRDERILLVRFVFGCEPLGAMEGLPEEGADAAPARSQQLRAMKLAEPLASIVSGYKRRGVSISQAKTLPREKVGETTHEKMLV